MKANTFLIASLSVFLRMKNVSDKVVEKFETPIFYLTFFPKILPFVIQCGNTLKSGAGHR